MSSQQPTRVAAKSPGDAFYIETSLPTGVTIASYRRTRPRRPTLWKRLRSQAP